MRLIVLPVRARASQGEPMLRAVVNEMAVQELAAVIGIQPEQTKGNRLRITSSAVKTSSWRLLGTPMHSVQPLATSVATNVNKTGRDY
jgi:hypothetical protein